MASLSVLPVLDFLLDTIRVSNIESRQIYALAPHSSIPSKLYKRALQRESPR